jgi:membrane-associated phospholipid phosphatase
MLGAPAVESDPVALRFGYGRYPRRVALRERALAAAPTGRAAVALAGLAAALAVVTALVAAGLLNGLDQYSVDHLMPWLEPNSQGGDGTAGYYRPFSLHTTTLTKVLSLWTYPCSLVISFLIVVWAAVKLWRRGPVVALLPAAAWVVGNAIEVIGKRTIVRPGLYGGSDRIHIVVFDDSFPSGHMIRGIVVAFAIALVYPRATRWVALWALLVAPALVLQSAHTLTDVIGGTLVGLILVILMVGVLREEGVELGRP